MLESATLPAVCESLPSATFQDCTSLKEITLPDSLTAIRSNAFANCDALTTITIPTGVSVIESSAFSDCDALTTINIPEGTTSIGSNAFYDCDVLTTAIISDTVTTIENNIFESCDLLTNVTLGASLTSIPSEAFMDCASLEKLVVPYRVTSIGSNAFKNDTKFTAITIPKSVTEIDSTAFSYPKKLTISGVAGSYAQTFATEQEIAFVNLDVAAESLTLNKTECNLYPYDTEKLLAVVKPLDYTGDIEWSSSDSETVSVDENGKIRAEKTGTATIIVQAGEKMAQCEVKVLVPVDSITVENLTSNSNTMAVNTTHQLKWTVSPDNAANKNVLFSSSDETVATVDNKGLITALKAGSVRITLTSEDGQASRNVYITVVDESTTPGESANLGDIDGNGKVQLVDAQTALKMALRITDCTTSQLAIADVDKDGKCTLSDSKQILKYALKIILEYSTTIENNTLTTATLAGKVKDGQLYCTISVENGDMAMFDLGLSYDADNLTVSSIEWNDTFIDEYNSNGGLIVKSDIVKDAYVAMGGVCIKDELLYTGEVATIIFEVKDSEADIEGMILMPDCSLKQGDFSGAANTEGTDILDVNKVLEDAQENVKPSESPMPSVSQEPYSSPTPIIPIQPSVSKAPSANIAPCTSEQPISSIKPGSVNTGGNISNQTEVLYVTNMEDGKIKVVLALKGPYNLPDQMDYGIVYNESLLNVVSMDWSMGDNYTCSVEDKGTYVKATANNNTTMKTAIPYDAISEILTIVFQKKGTNAGELMLVKDSEQYEQDFAKAKDNESTIVVKPDTLIAVGVIGNVVEKEEIKVDTGKDNATIDSLIGVIELVKDLLDRVEELLLRVSILAPNGTAAEVQKYEMAQQMLADKEYSKITVYEMNFVNEDMEEVCPNEEVKASFKIPEGYDRSKIKVLHLKDNTGMTVQATNSDITEYEATISEDGKSAVIHTSRMGIFAIVETTETIEDFTLGDVNQDGTVDLSDAQLTLKAALKIQNIDEMQKKAADADGNGAVELADAQKILKAALKIIEL